MPTYTSILLIFCCLFAAAISGCDDTSVLPDAEPEMEPDRDTASDTPAPFIVFTQASPAIGQLMPDMGSIRRARADGSDLSTILAEPHYALYSAPVDGAMALLTVLPDEEEYCVCLYREDDGELMPITVGAEDFQPRFPMLAPSGEFIAIYSEPLELTANSATIVVYDLLDFDTEPEIIHGVEPNTLPAISFASNHISYFLGSNISVRDRRQNSILTIAQVQTLPADFTSDLVWLPDDSAIVFSSGGGDYYDNNIFIAQSDNGGFTNLTNDRLSSMHPHAHNGKIAYVTFNGTDQVAQLCMMNYEGESKEVLLNVPSKKYYFKPKISPNSRYVLFLELPQADSRSQLLPTLLAYDIQNRELFEVAENVLTAFWEE